MVEYKKLETQQIQHTESLYTDETQADELIKDLDYIKETHKEQLKDVLVFTIKYKDGDKFVVRNTVFDKTILN